MHQNIALSAPISRREVLGLSVTGALAGSIALGSSSPATAATTLHFGDGKIIGTAGSVRDSLQVSRRVVALNNGDITKSWDALPFQQFEIPAPSEATSVKLNWKGNANANSRVRLLIWNFSKNLYEEVAAAISAKDGAVALSATIPLAERVSGAKLRAVVQHSIGFSGNNVSFRDTPVTPEHKSDTPRKDYDFTLAWESDTQYYNESFPQRQLDIHDYLLRQRTPMNIHYVFHTGDIVDEYDKPIQWERANKAYTLFDHAKFPYGVLGGNHDVGQYDEKGFPIYTQHFGASRFQNNPWYGETHKNNRGHYDLISAGGHNFIMVYMSWGAKDPEIAWLNKVLASFPERTAILALHDYIDTTGKMTATPLRIKNEVVAKNPNIRLVLSGHFHGTLVTRDVFNDAADGGKRVVTNILFDAQGLPEGGQAFTRLMHFDNYGGRMISRTYSPYLKKHNSDHRALPHSSQEFVVSYNDLGLRMRQKTLSTSAFTATF